MMHISTFVAVAKFTFDRRDLESKEKHVLIAFGHFVNSETKEAWPSHETISEMTGLSEKTVQRAIRRLEDRGILVNRGQKLKTDGFLGPNLYVLNIPLEADGKGGQSDHRRPSSRNEDIDIKNRGSVVRETTPPSDHETPQPAGSSWGADVARTLCYLLADELIERGMKDRRFRDDASSNAWIYRMEDFVNSNLGWMSHRVGEADWDLFVRIYEEAVSAAPEALDLKICSDVFVPPRLLVVHADELLGRAAERVLGGEERDPFSELAWREEVTQPNPEAKEFIEEMTMRMREQARIREQSRATERSRLRRQKSGASYEPTPKEARENEVFAEEIEHLLQDGEERCE